MKGYKTALVALAITTVGAVQTFFQQVEMDPQTQGWILMGIGVAMAGLRAITTSPLFKDE
jgi:hypothetical protein